MRDLTYSVGQEAEVFSFSGAMKCFNAGRRMSGEACKALSDENYQSDLDESLDDYIHRPSTLEGYALLAGLYSRPKYIYLAAKAMREAERDQK